jgi:two-component system response regulator PrrA
MSRTLLVIDDEPAWHKLLRRIFDGSGFLVHTASGFREGVMMAERHKPDCIVLDFHLKDGDALDVCAALREDGRLKYPVIIFSSDPCAEIITYAECRADFFVLKGSHAMMELPAIVERMLAHAGG